MPVVSRCRWERDFLPFLQEEEFFSVIPESVDEKRTCFLPVARREIGWMELKVPGNALKYAMY